MKRDAILNRSVCPVDLIVGLIPFLLFWRIAIGQQTFYLFDLQYLFYPRFKASISSFQAGEFPWWNPWSFCGMPQFGDSQAGILYPLSVFFHLFNPSHAMGLFIITHISIAGLGMVRLGRALKFDNYALIVMGISFEFCGFLTGHIVHPSILAGVAWIPWIFVSLCNLIDFGQYRYFALLVLFLALQFLSGHPQPAAYTALAVLLYSMCTRNSNGLIYKSMLIILAYFFAGMICSPQLLPLWEMMQSSNRTHINSPDYYSAISLSIASLQSLLFPLFDISLASKISLTAPTIEIDQYVKSSELCLYSGIFTLVGATFALLSWLKGLFYKRKDARDEKSKNISGFVGIFILGVFLSFGRDSGSSWLLSFVPLFNRMRAPCRAYMLCSFAIATLSAFAVDGRFKSGRYLYLKQVLCLLMAIDLFYFAYSFQPKESASILERTPEAVTFLKEDRSLFRKISVVSEFPSSVLDSSEILFGSWSTAFGISDINGYNSLQPKYISDLLLDFGDLSYGLFPENLLTENNLALLSLLNTKYFLFPRNVQPIQNLPFREVYANGRVKILENKSVSPRFFFVPKVQAISDPEALNKMKSEPVNFRELAFVEKGALLKHEEFSTDADVKVENYGINSVTLNVQARADAFLVISDSFYPGWRAYIDGEEARIIRTDYLLKGIELPKGNYTLHLRYRSDYMVYGVALFLLGVTFTLCSFPLVRNLKSSPKFRE